MLKAVINSASLPTLCFPAPLITEEENLGLFILTERIPETNPQNCLPTQVVCLRRHLLLAPRAFHQQTLPHPKTKQNVMRNGGGQNAQLAVKGRQVSEHGANDNGNVGFLTDDEGPSDRGDLPPRGNMKTYLAATALCTRLQQRHNKRVCCSAEIALDRRF